MTYEYVTLVCGALLGVKRLLVRLFRSHSATCRSPAIKRPFSSHLQPTWCDRPPLLPCQLLARRAPRLRRSRGTATLPSRAASLRQSCRSSGAWSRTRQPRGRRSRSSQTLRRPRPSRRTPRARAKPTRWVRKRPLADFGELDSGSAHPRVARSCLSLPERLASDWPRRTYGHAVGGVRATRLLAPTRELSPNRGISRPGSTDRT